MKRFISAILAIMMVMLTLPIFSASAADTSPILWYDFEDGAKDISGSGNDGTVNEAFITDSTAVFDGVDNYIKLPDGILKDVVSATVAIYLKPEIEKQNQFTWCIGNTTETGYMFLNTYNPSSKLRAAITQGTYTDESALVSDSNG